MANRTFTRHEARKSFGQRFVEIMMKDKREISLSEKQLVAAKRWKMVYEGMFSPFHYDYVYVVSNGRGSVKVGFSQCPKKRMGSLSTGSADELAVRRIFVMRGNTGRNLEKAAHRALKNAGKHVKGEWFEEHGALDIIEDVAKTGYQTSILELEAAWEGSEELVPIARFALKGDVPALNYLDERRSEFLWVATLARAKYSVDLQDVLR